MSVVHDSAAPVAHSVTALDRLFTPKNRSVLEEASSFCCLTEKSGP